MTTDGPKIVVIEGDWEDPDVMHDLVSALREVLNLLPYDTHISVQDDPAAQR